MRKGSIKRLSKETNIQLSLTIEGRGRYQVSTGIRFFDHMLELFAHHGGFDLRLKARGDLDVDQHHTVEDVGIVLGQAFDKALGSKRGILRAGYFLMPMDETMGSADARRPWSTPRFALAWSAICRRNWCTTSSKASRGERAQTFTPASSMDDRAITKLKRSSRHLRAPCVPPAGATRG